VGDRQTTRHSIQADMTTWGRTQFSRDNIKYHMLEPVVAQGFTSRVLAMFYSAMRSGGFLRVDPDRPHRFEHMDTIDDALCRLTPRQYMELIEQVRESAFTLSAWNGENHGDIEFRTMCRMLQEAEMFLTVHHAVKHGDIGLLRRLVDPLIIYFFGASQHNYGHEMLFYRWLLSPANSDELQRSILSSGLVNWPGQATTFKPIDLGLEHLNGACKIELKCYKNSTHDVDLVLDRICLTNTWNRELRAKIEERFGTYVSGNHSTASAMYDMFSLARKLFNDDLGAPRPPNRLAGLGRVFDSEDIMKTGVNRVVEKVALFNEQHVRHHGELQESYPSLERLSRDELTSFQQVDDYVAVFDETNA